MADAPVPGLYKGGGITALRYPGGSTSDVYHWQTNSSTNGSGQYVNPNNNFDAFMAVAQASGATPVITVNYGSNPAGTDGADPAEAAAWVDYANNTKRYGVKYWEVGNEVYGNKEYGGNWETDLHTDQSPTAYGKNVVLFSQAMKAKDPTIKVGAVLISPGSFPDGNSPDWNTNVLANCGTAIDFVIIHPYAQDPGQESDAGLLNTPGGYAAKMSKLRSLLAQYCGANAAKVEVCCTETNSVSSNPGKQTVSVVNALFLADAYSTWLKLGVTNVDWWASHNGVTYGNSSGSLYGSTSYGDYGVLSSGQGSEPYAETPFPAYDGFQMLTKLGQGGDLFVTSTSSQTLLATQAVHRANGNLALLLINKDPANSYTANVSVSGYTPASSSTDYFYGESSGTGGITSGASTAGASFTRTVPPYSLTTVVMHSTTNAPPTPSPTPTASPSPTATPTPTATPKPSPTASPIPKPNPTPTPTPIVTPAPGGSYQVSYAVSNQWDSGFTANVTITNGTTAALNGWMVGWTFPGNQQITNAWNGTASQHGQAVTVADAGYNAVIPAGGSTSFGFQGSYAGTNVNPAAFTLNGKSVGGSGNPTPTPIPPPTATPTPTVTPTPAPIPTPKPLAYSDADAHPSPQTHPDANSHRFTNPGHRRLSGELCGQQPVERWLQRRRDHPQHLRRCGQRMEHPVELRR